MATFSVRSKLTLSEPVRSTSRAEIPARENCTERITAGEKAKILARSESFASKANISSICLSGPKVAGYPVEDSGYDVLVVTRDNLEPSVVSKFDTEINSTILIVNETHLIHSAKQFSDQEYIVGRLLNVYEPVVNPEFLRNVETEYKRRVIVEELSVIQKEFGLFSINLVIPLQYFLFNRLHNMALFFPAALASIACTYTGPRKKDNIEFSLEGFRIAAGLLEPDGIIEKNDDAVRLLQVRSSIDALSKLLERLRTGNVVTMKREKSAPRSDLLTDYEFEIQLSPDWETVKGNVECDPELDRPKTLVRLEEGAFLDSENIAGEVARIYRFDDKYQFKQKKLGSLVNSSTKLEIWDSQKKSKFVLKQFRELESAKWAFLNSWAVLAKQFSMTPTARLTREVQGVRWMHKLGINTHRIVGVAMDKKILVTEFVEGVPLAKYVQEVLDGYSLDTTNIEKYGTILGRMHKENLMYGDTKPQNALVGQKGIYLLDLEQCIENADAAWDIAEFLYYSAAQLEREKENDATPRYPPNSLTTNERMAVVTKALLDAYEKENGKVTIGRASDLRYVTPFLSLLGPDTIWVIRKLLKEYAQGPDSDIIQN